MKRPEEALQRTVVDWMRAVFPPPPEGPVWFHVPNGGGRSKAEGGVVCVCRSLEDVRGFIDVLGIPTRERRPA